MNKILFKSDIFRISKKDFISVDSADDEVVISSYKDYIDTIKLGKRMQKGIVIFNDTDTFEITSGKLTFRIDQEIYLYDENTSEVYEVYDINNVKTENKLGVLKNTNHFVWSKDINQK